MPQSASSHIISTDTATADSSQQHVAAPFVPAYVNGFPDSTGNSHEQMRLDRQSVMMVPEGSDCEQFQNTPLHDAGMMGIVFAAFFMMAIAYKKGSKYVSDFVHNMFSVRKRENAFEDHTVNETQIMIALLVNTCVMEGMALYIGLAHMMPSLQLSANVFMSVGVLTGVAGVYYLFQVGIYNLLGYVFGDKIGTKLWVDGFNASQSILGLVLFPVVFVGLLYPDTIKTVLICAIILYIIAKFVFISKGIRIFFNNLASTIYFILYLCAIEIVPVIITLSGAIYLCVIIQS